MRDEKIVLNENTYFSVIQVQQVIYLSQDTFSYIKLGLEDFR
jgi:hypothetical protein